MSVSMYTVSVPIFIQFLTALSGVLDKAQAHIEAKKFDESFIMTNRIYPDMHNFTRQVRASCDHAVNACGRIAGVDLPTFENNETTIADLKTRIEKSLEFLRAIRPEQLDGQEEKQITVKFTSGERSFTGQSMLINFSLPNFYFHTTTAYALLRHVGVEIGKRDFMGSPVKA